MRPLFGLRETADVQNRSAGTQPTAGICLRPSISGAGRPAGGLYAAEMQRVMFPSVSNPLRQPYAAFNQPELLTILIQTIAGTYLAGRAAGAITNAEQAAAEAAAREEVRRTIRLYCAGQPNNGAGIEICTRHRASV